MIVKVGLDLPVRRLFDYLADPGQEAPPLGSRVRVTCAGRDRCGVVAGYSKKSSLPKARLLPIEEHLAGPVLPADLLECMDAAARNFFLPQGRLLLRCLPQSLRQPRSLADWQEASVPAWRGRSPSLPAGLNKRLAEIIASSDAGKPLLISGVAGSGKGELLVALIARQLASGGRVLLLAPTVAATEAWYERLAAGVPEAKLAQVHSGMKASQLRKNWLASVAGSVHAVVGARGAVFVPIPDLALIAVVDEDDGGHRAVSGLRYSAREIAALRAHTRSGCRLALLSATPSLEIRHAARIGALLPVALPRPAGFQAPSLNIVRIGGRRLFGGISGEFELLVSRMMRAGRKVAVLISRADPAGAIACCGCGHICRCRTCARPLVEDAAKNTCRSCRILQKLPSVCPVCKGSDFAPVPAATGRIAEALSARLPEARIVAASGGDSEPVQKALAADAVDVLVGGRELAALEADCGAVVLADVDNALFSYRITAVPDLLAAVSRLAWRQSGCEILAQTRFPDHHMFEALNTGMHDSYALAELEQRRKSGLPPFRRLALIGVRGTSEAKMARFLGRLRQLGQVHRTADVVIFDPVPGPRSFKGKHRNMQVLISAARRSLLTKTLSSLLAELEAAPTSHGLHWDLEVDPPNW